MATLVAPLLAVVGVAWWVAAAPSRGPSPGSARGSDLGPRIAIAAGAVLGSIQLLRAPGALSGLSAAVCVTCLGYAAWRRRRARPPV